MILATILIFSCRDLLKIMHHIYNKSQFHIYIAYIGILYFFLPIFYKLDIVCSEAFTFVYLPHSLYIYHHVSPPNIFGNEEFHKYYIFHFLLEKCQSNRVFYMLCDQDAFEEIWNFRTFLVFEQ